MSEIPVEELNKETLEKLGVKLPPALSEVGANLVVLGRVFSALKGLEDEDALRVLKQAQMYIISRKNGLDIDSLSLPTDEAQNSYAPPIDWTLQVVAKIYKLKPADLKQRKKDATVTQARQVAMYVLCMTNKYSQTAIGLAIGGRTSATVGHAFARISHKVAEDPELLEKVEGIQKLIVG